jgi:dTDP-4-dehydrorhamnose 3,5-epimerase
MTDNIYSKENETGILWDSINFDWPVANPLLSSRDKSFVKLSKI